jgi:type I restriction enzyme R subunit
MSPTPEADARAKIDLLLEKAGWVVQDARAAKIQPPKGLPFGSSPWPPGMATRRTLNHQIGRATRGLCYLSARHWPSHGSARCH